MTLFPVVCISFALDVKLGLSLTCRVIVDVLPIVYGSDDTEYSSARRQQISTRYSWKFLDSHYS